jgi:pyruvate/2-oxoglutarate dehydrogenase complex dihydrolipoamide dehydrogenase (E3) component/rhodanese-related sulfurtransferase
MAEQLRRRGLSVTVFERNSHILPPFDLEMAAQLHEELKRNDVALRLHATVTAFEAPRATERAAASVVVTEGGERFPADVILFGIGVRPEVRLALDAGIVVGPRGGIRVDDTMRTSHPDIWALGDCVETTNVVTGTSGVLPLAGPANRQGRLVAENIIRKAGTPTRYRGTLGTAVVRVFEYVAACTGANERTLQSEAIDYEAVHVHASSHASYYPGAYPVSLKLLFDRKNGRVLGAQAVGKEGVDKRIDVIATAIAGKMTVDDLTHLELCYAPPIGSAKDVVNMAGMAASNIVHGIVRFAHWRDLAARREASMILDVRDESEWEKGHIPGAVHIPLNQLRTRLSELPNGREIIAYCHSGQRSYNACRILMAHGFDCRNLSGAYKTWSAATAEV